MTELQDKVRAQVWEGDALRMLDQRRLPQEEVWITCASAEEVAEAIKAMVVRGAPAIGIAAAYGVVLAARQCTADGFDKAAYASQIERLRASRPTAVNLFWALDRMQRLPLHSASDVPALEAEAKAIEAEDLAANRHMAELGAALIPEGSRVLTHCNTGSLATAGMGTALGVIRQGVAEGRVRKVYADETRPWLQGTRLTAWELQKDGIDVTLLSDSAAALLMKQGGVDWIIVGADRITANGDVANKIGTYGLAVLARHHGLRFMVVAPSSTVDMSMASGDLIPIEERDPVEIWRPYEAVGAAWNPVFDVTPADLVDVIVTERSVVKSPDAASMQRMMACG